MSMSLLFSLNFLIEYKRHEFARPPGSYGGLHSREQLIIVLLPCLLPAGGKDDTNEGEAICDLEVLKANVFLLHYSPPAT